MLKIILFKNPKKLYQKIISFLFNTKYYHLEYVLEHNEEEYFLRSNFSGNELSTQYLSYLSEDIEIKCFNLKKSEEKKLFNYFIGVNNTKYNFKELIKWFIEYRIYKKKYKDFNNTIYNNKFNCFNHYINIKNILKKDLIW